VSNQDIEIRVFGSRPELAARDLGDEARVREVIRNHVLPEAKGNYLRVNVEVKRTRDQRPRYLIAYLLRSDIYLAEVVRVDVDEQYNVEKVSYDYNVSADKEAEAAEEDEEDHLPYEEGFYGVDFVAATPVPEIPTAAGCITHVNNQAAKVGLSCKVLSGATATVANYKQYLQSGLKGFVNVGHGFPGGIVLADGTLDAATLQKLTKKPLSPGVIYWNSCQVFNNPLKDAVMQAGARTFVGGIVNLQIGPSEEVCKCFWTKTLTSDGRMGDILRQCEKDKYPQTGAHGISGDVGPFRLKLTEAMWTHGHSLQIENPDCIENIWRAGFYVAVRGKPGTDNWFHFAIPTTVIVDERRLRVGSVLVLFDTDSPDAVVRDVHIYDGPNKIAEHDGVNLSGNAGCRRFDVPTHPNVYWGIGISLGVHFGTGAGGRYMRFHSAGCDFVP
jgi:hypothetical protein